MKKSKSIIGILTFSMVILFSTFLIIPTELFAEEPGSKKYSNHQNGIIF